MTPFGWLILLLIFLGAELAFHCLVSLWFSAGAAAAFALSLGGISLGGQLLGFGAVSFLTLILIRPAAFFFGGYFTGRHKKAGGQDEASVGSESGIRHCP